MARSLSYADAVRLLGGADSRTVDALDKITGGLLLGGSVAVPALLALFDAKAEFVRLSHEVVRDFAERRSGLSRYGRTQRLEAAHAVLVITAFFEGMDEADLPFTFGALGLPKADQVRVAAGSSLTAVSGFVEEVMLAGALLPSPQSPRENMLLLLRNYYWELAERVSLLVTGLSVWEALPENDQERFVSAMRGVPDQACARYEELVRRLAVDFPEVAWWLGQREHEATRAAVGHLDLALAQIGRALDAISTGRAPDDRRDGLARAYRKSLERPVIESGETPEGLDVPTLEQAYLPPRFRVSDVHGEFRPSEESCWAEVPVREDLEEFLTAYLTSPQAARGPLLVLGQPGSGKSVFTRVLAARLPANDFLPVRVILRDVPAGVELQDQLERAIKSATGERVEWPDLVRSAPDALPVILLDGFDELLQAVGVSHTDYLDRVAEFQRREADQGRAVAVIVTSRTAVADKARSPVDTVALRLEPFDDARITAWLDIWNSVNAVNLTRRRVSPLSATAVLAQRELAEQPLLLLMLALYDADANALQNVAIGLSQRDLYEQLLRSFAAREVEKQRAGLSPSDLDRAVEEELRRLSIVAFAMFNRASLWVTEGDLESDLGALFGTRRRAAGPDLRAPLPVSELTLGRFFFMHRARALQDNTQLQTYEFLHATFGEFLVARLTWQVLGDMSAREAASTLSLDDGPAADDLLRALLSFQPLSYRAPVIGFLEELAGTLEEPGREALAALLTRLFRAVHDEPPAVRFAGYRPRPVTEPARYAAYSANLLLLALCVAGAFPVSSLYRSGAEVVELWRGQTLLWHSQFDPDARPHRSLTAAPARCHRRGTPGCLRARHRHRHDKVPALGPSHPDRLRGARARPARDRRRSLPGAGRGHPREVQPSRLAVRRCRGSGRAMRARVSRARPGQ